MAEHIAGVVEGKRKGSKGGPRQPCTFETGWTDDGRVFVRVRDVSTKPSAVVMLEPGSARLFARHLSEGADAIEP